MSRIISILIAFTFFACNSEEKQFVFQGEAQGTTYTVKYIANEEQTQLNSRIESLLETVDLSMSTYRSDSKISALNNGEEIVMDEMFEAVYNRSVEIYDLTSGAFDPTIGPLISGWGFNVEKPINMDSTAVDSLLANCGFSHFTKNGRNLKLSNTKASINFNAIAQGYSVDLMADVLKEAGLVNYYVELGGEIIVKGKNQEGKFWQIGIDKPLGENLERSLSHIIPLNNKAMATSGNYRKYYEKDGEKYSHTLNPKTGFPVEHTLLSATVIADNCIDSDAFGTSFMVLGLNKSKEILAQNKSLDAILIYSDGDSLKSYYTPRIADSIIELK